MTDSNPHGNPIAADVLGTNYPYLNIKRNLLTSVMQAYKKLILPINPFAMPQIANQENAAIGIRNGNSFYVPETYPNPIQYTKWMPSHYDPLKDSSKHFNYHLARYAPSNTNLIFVADKLPRGCVRTLQVYRRCKDVNGKENCHEEADEILSICPNWALDAMKEKKRQVAKIEAIQNKTLKEVMEVSPYNSGRTVKDISDKTWIHGTREHLRPDTMWADERYSKITQPEINEAKKRLQEKKAKEGVKHAHDDHHHDHHSDFKHEAIRHPKPNYP